MHPQFDSDRDLVLARARAAGVQDLVVTATDLDMSRTAIDYCEQKGLYCTAGVHPHDAKDAPADLGSRLLALARSHRVRAIGETGLDFYRNFSPQDAQRAVFREQLEVAAEIGLPAFVHDRDTAGAVFEMLAEFRPRLTGAVVHCFTGTAEDLARYLSLDVYIGITGWVADRRRGAPLAEVIRSLPLDRLVIETDAPFLKPHNVPAGWYAEHGVQTHTRRNEPALLPFVARAVSRAMDVPETDVIAQSTANARSLFGLD